mgnify:CR=1 FL=1
MISVTIRLFASYREIIGKSSILMNVSKGALVSDLLTDLLEQYPQLAGNSSKIVVAVNHEYQTNSYTLHTNDEVALIPPVSGGG